MNFNIYNNNIIFNIGLAKLDIMYNAMHMACRAQFNDQRRLWSISSLLLSLKYGVLIIISSIGKKSDKCVGIVSNTFSMEYRYRYRQYFLW